VPVHPPEAVQLVTFAELQLKFDAVPLFTVVGFAIKVMEGTPAAETETVTASVMVPPGPVHEILYVVVAVSAPDD
jgi:hypothetical protein